MNYTKTPAKVFTAFTTRLLLQWAWLYDTSMLTNSSSYHLVYFVPQELGMKFDLGLASWVPDWRQIGIRGMMDVLSVPTWPGGFISRSLNTPTGTNALISENKQPNNLQ